MSKDKDKEPTFTLRAQDCLAPGLIDEWTRLAKMLGVNNEKVESARQVAADMRAWQERTGKRKRPD